ncbi:DUF2344 domain-containing protein [bacterium]|nr:DUF2344 domain-containing protein [bacterium]
MDFHEQLEKVVSQVSKPAKYLGLERNVKITKFSANSVKTILAFPDVYEIGINFYPLNELYHKINLMSGIFAERFYAVGKEFQTFAAENGISAFSLETKTPLQKAKVIFFPVLSPLQMIEVIEILNFAQIPLKASQRSENDPIIICWLAFANPFPLQDFADCFLVSKSCLSFLEFTEILKLRESTSKQEILEQLKAQKGIWSKGTDFSPLENETESDENFTSDKELVPIVDFEFGKQKYGSFPILTLGNSFVRISDYFSKDGVFALKTITEGILPAYDYEGLREIIETTRGFLTDTSSQTYINFLRRTRKFGLSFGIFTASEKLRNALNLGGFNKDFLDAFRIALDNKWKKFNFFFLYCLPSENETHLQENADLINKIIKICELQKEILIEVNFIPFFSSPNTPFQWLEVPDFQTIQKAQNFLNSKIVSDEKLTVDFGNTNKFYLQGMLLRARNSELLEFCVENQVLENTEEIGFSNFFVEFENLKKQTSFETEFGWEKFSKVGKRDLVRQMQKFFLGEMDLDFPYSRISMEKYETGFNKTVLTQKKRKILESSYGNRVKKLVSPRSQLGIFNHYRLHFEKSGKMRFVNVIDLGRIFEQAFSLSKINVTYTNGYLPTAKINFGLPVHYGVESLFEYCDVDFENPIDYNDVKKINGKLPEGLRVLNGKPIPPKLDSIAMQVNFVSYQFDFSGITEEQKDKISKKLGQDEIFITRVKKDEEVILDLKPFFAGFRWNENNFQVDLLIDETKRTIKFSELLDLLKLEGENLEIAKMQRIGQFILRNGQKLTPLEVE